MKRLARTRRIVAAAWRPCWRVGLGLGVAASVAAIGYVLLCPYPAETLAPDGSGPLQVLDRRGVLLRTIPAATAAGRPGRRAWVPLDQVSSHAVLTLLASEDQRFFDHRGVDPVGILRAVWLNLRSARLAYGGSTITMQLMKLVHSPGRRRTLVNKARESLHALRLERALGKRAILEQYVNRVYFGHGAYGIEAAAQTYFGKPAASLSVGEATLLSVLPRGPRYYDPIRRLPRALARRDHLFTLLVAQGRMTPAEVRRARAQPLSPALRREPFLAPHFVDWVVGTLPPTVRRRGGTLHTSLDLELQRVLERRVQEHLEERRPQGIRQAGLVVLDGQSSEVLAMVGSRDYRTHQVNIVTRRRHPGSTLKPFVYAAAMETLGHGPGTVVHDVRDQRGSAYQPPRVTQREHGPVRYREALAGSYNLAAVHVLERVGVSTVLTRLRLAGVGDLPGGARAYGLRLALGSTKVRLLDLAAGYGFLVRAGRVRPARGVRALQRRTAAGKARWHPQGPRDRQVFSAQTSWLVMDMLADAEARRPMFGPELAVDLPYPIAVKTGTARGFADTVAVAATHELIVAAWAGNFDGRPNHGVQAMRGAAPLVRAALLVASRGRRLTLPERPAGLERATLCPLSGKLAGPYCPHRTREHVRAGQAPTEPCGWHRRDAQGRLQVRYPPEIDRWAERQRTRGGRHI